MTFAVDWGLRESPNMLNPNCINYLSKTHCQYSNYAKYLDSDPSAVGYPQFASSWMV